MILTEADLRDRLRRPTQGAVVAVPPHERLSPAAADFVAQWKLVLAPEPETASPDHGAGHDRGNAVGHGPAHDGGSGADRAQPGHGTGGAPAPNGERPGWDRDAEFPVDRAADAPLCTQCGSAVHAKPSWLTQLNRGHYVLKTHPRIVLRGQLDSLGGHLLGAAAEALAAGQDQAGADLATLAAYCRELLSAEYNERPAADLTLEGWDAEAIRRATHDPRAALGVDHVTLTERSHLLQHRVNGCRTRAREVEVTAAGVFPSPHHPYGPSICLGLNRLSSACYLVQLLLIRGGIG